MFKGGYVGKVLYVDLSKKKIVKKPLSKDLVQNFLGGRGFTSKVLYDHIRSDVDPLSPRNKLIFATGPLTGTLAPSSSRFVVAARSPLTSFLGDANSGGHWGPELKFAGYDMIVIDGRAEKPVYLWVNDDEVEIKYARHIWGRDTRETERIIKEDLSCVDARIASIGQAGENLVKFASVIVDLDHAAGRTGMGAVMGSKNLKAIAVHGTQGVRIANPDVFIEVINKLMNIITTDPRSSITAPKLGTTAFLSEVQKDGGLATLNWQTGVFDGAEKISGETLRETYLVTATACFACPLRSDRYCRIDDGPFKGTYVGGPEYFALVNFGSKCGNDNLASIIKANELVNLYGLDVGSTGGIIGFVMECYEKGILTKDDVDGLNLDRGNYESILKLIKKIAFREGFGDLLAEGIKTAAEKIGKGAEKYAMHVKGMDIVTVDPRCHKAYSLRYAVASRGGDHLRLQAIVDKFELDRLPFDEAGERLVWWENLMSVLDATGVCKFTYSTFSSSRQLAEKKALNCLSKLYSSATGIDIDPKTLLTVGERITNIERLFNLRMGLQRKDDSLPRRFIEEPLPEGPMKGSVYDVFEPLLNAYYKARGWDERTGIPTTEKLENLKLNKTTNP